MHKGKRFVIFLIMAACMTGCEKKPAELTENEPPVETAAHEPEEATLVFVDTAKPVAALADTGLYYVTDYTPALYEPAEGCYIGAYILGNRMMDFDMRKFESITEKEHSQYVYNYKLGEAFPVDWLLSCVANNKTPYIVVLPPNDYWPLDESLLSQAAKDFGEFYVPIFVAFYPNPAKLHVDAEAYKSFFRKARSIFQQEASNTAFVWSVDAKEAYSSNAYYPGDSFVDWVGISVYNNIYEKGTLSEWDLWDNIDYFYHAYQQKKPVMLTALAISHYSTVDHKYRTQRAVDEVTKTYALLMEKYPRIKAVQYIDFNHSRLTGTDNYTVSDNDEILAAYQQAVEQDYFLSELEIGNGRQRKEKMNSAYPLLAEGTKLYICENAVRYELAVTVPAIDPQYVRTVADVDYYDLEKVALLLNMTVERGEENGHILLSIADWVDSD